MAYSEAKERLRQAMIDQINPLLERPATAILSAALVYENGKASVVVVMGCSKDENTEGESEKLFDMLADFLEVRDRLPAQTDEREPTTRN
jgi:hypothetical protein